MIAVIEEGCGVAPTKQATALVSGGAGGGIGRGICTVLAEHGWQVAVADLDADAATAVATELGDLGHKALAVRLDVSDETSVAEALATTRRELGVVTGLVNSAGVGLITPFAETTPEEWDRLHGVDLRGAFLLSRAAIPGMIEAGGGAIVNIGSIQALAPHTGYAAYAAAKAGLVGMTRGIAADHGRDGIRCSVVHPGMVDSPQTRELLARWGDPQEWIDDYLWTRQMIPVAVRPRDIGEAVSFLLAAPSVTAAELVVDGGSSRMAFDREPRRRQ